jgi:hypothetical protein
VVMTAVSELSRALTGYADRVHRVAGGDGDKPGQDWSHHVVSPLGAWMLLALCGPASGGADRDELATVLGMDVDAASATAATLLDTAHPAVLAAAAAWFNPATAPTGGALSRWSGRLPAVVERGPLPSQAELDAWAAGHTGGLIDRFPLTVSPRTVVVLATALATKVSWEVPFQVAPAGELPGWADRLRTVLTTAPVKPTDNDHRQFIASTPLAGDVAVHVARAREGLLVMSVIAERDVAPADVLTAAYGLAAGADALTGTVHPAARSPFDLPTGTAALWTITEEAVQTTAPDGREERYTATLPAWSAQGEYDLLPVGPGEPADLGFATAMAALCGDAEAQVRQSTVARYTRTGFEAAAVTGGMMLTSMPVMRDGVRRTAALRFGHPYAVVAVAGDDGAAGSWGGLPVFSGWVAEPDDAEPDPVD